MMRRTTTVTLVVLLLAVGAVPVAGTALDGTATNQATQNVSISEIQQPTDGSGDSPYAGQTVTTSGVVTAVNSGGFFVQNGTGHYSGVFVSGSTNVSAGATVEINAPVEENFNNTLLNASASGATVTTTGQQAVPNATPVSTANASAEAYEGVLIEVTDLNVSSVPNQFGEWGVTDGSGELRIDDVDTGDGTTPSEVDATIDALRGPVFYSFGEFKVQPSAVDNLTAPTTNQPNVTGPTLTVLSYNDVQTAASDPTAMGRLVGTINERRAAHTNPTVVIGGGDQVSPSSLSPVSNWTVPIGALNVLDPGAEVIGNHDLDYGFTAVPNFTNASDFPWLLANVVDSDGNTVPGTSNYTLLQRGNLTVGVVGLVDDAIKSKTAVDFAANGYTVADYNKVGSRIATDLKQNHGADVVIAAAHIGVPESKDLARNTDNIDVIVTGDDEIYYPPEVTDGAVITEATGNADHVGELNLTVGANGTEMESGRLIEIGSDSPVNKTTEKYVNTSRGKFLSTVAGETTVVLNSTFSNYNVETAWGNLVTDAFRAKTGAEVAITNAGGIRGNFKFGPGQVTYDDIYTSLPFGNTLVTKELSGLKLEQLLTSQVTTLESSDGQQFGEQAALQVSGVTYEYVPHESATDLVRDVHVNGDPLERSATYNVTVNSYMAGWDLFGYNWSLANQTTVDRDLTLYGTAAVQYVENNTPVSPSVEGRIQRVDATGTANVTTDAHNVSVTVTQPPGFDGLNGSVQLTAPAADRVEPEATSTDNDTITATFDRENVTALANDTGANALELYAEYDSTEYDLVFHDHARLNADVPTDAITPMLPGATGPANDTDGDGLLEDVDGDGSVDVFDAIALYNNRNAAIVQSNTQSFDFDGDGSVDVFDAVELYNAI